MMRHALLVAAALVFMAAGSRSGVEDLVPLVTGKLITPVGRQIPVGSFPVNMLLSPDGKYVVVTNAGFRQFLSVLSVEDGHVVSQIPVGTSRGQDKTGLYYGMAFGTKDLPGFRLQEKGLWPLFVSRGAEEKVSLFTLSDNGVLTGPEREYSIPSTAPAGKSPFHVAGIGIVPGVDGPILCAANNHTSPYTDMRGEVAFVDTSKPGQIANRIKTPGFPFAVAVAGTDTAKAKAYVSSERDGVVSVVRSGQSKVERDINTGDHPIALLLNKNGDRLYVANAGSDTVSIVDTKTDAVIGTFLLRPDDMRGLPGATPTGLALTPDEKKLYVTLGDMNAVAVVELPKGKLIGYIPVGWYPTAAVVSPDGKRLFVANAKGVRARNPNDQEVGKWGRYIENIIEGSVSVIPIPGDGELKQMTAQTLANNLIARNPDKTEISKIEDLKSKIEHVIYIVKENRTYDQVLGDLPQGNGDRSLCLFPREVTPNQHALAERFALLDNFYCCAEVSADGWDWSTSGMISEYTARNAPYNYSGRGKKYDFEGQNNGVPVDLEGISDVARAPSGYIWDQVAKKGISYRNYGFYLSFEGEGDRGPEGRPLAINNTPNKRVLVDHTDLDFLQFDMTYADSDAWRIADAACPKQRKAYGRFNAPSRFAEWKREFDNFVRTRTLPRFMMVRMPRDHTSGTTPDLHSPRAMVADNDFAIGQMVEAISASPYWEKTAIFILEDDAQNGFDHVDAHRSIAFVISPYVKAGSVDRRFYNTDSMLRTMGLLLGLPPLCQYDAVASPIAVFGERPENSEQYKAVLPDRKILAEVNQPTAYRAQDSARLDFRRADSVADEVLTDIVWGSVKGGSAQKPTMRRGLLLGGRIGAYD